MPSLGSRTELPCEVALHFAGDPAPRWDAFPRGEHRELASAYRTAHLFPVMLYASEGQAGLLHPLTPS